MMKMKHRRNGGFSLVEALLALLVLGIGSAALVSTLAVSKTLQEEAVAINEAGKIANAIVECFRRMPYIVLEDAVPAGTYQIDDLGTVYDGEMSGHELIESGLMYQLQSKLYEVRMSESVQVEQAPDAIRVTTVITPSGGQEGTPVSVVAFIAKNGINFR